MQQSHSPLLPRQLHLPPSHKYATQDHNTATQLECYRNGASAAAEEDDRRRGKSRVGKQSL